MIIYDSTRLSFIFRVDGSTMPQVDNILNRHPWKVTLDHETIDGIDSYGSSQAQLVDLYLNTLTLFAPFRAAVAVPPAASAAAAAAATRNRPDIDQKSTRIGGCRKALWEAPWENLQNPPENYWNQQGNSQTRQI